MMRSQTKKEKCNFKSPNKKDMFKRALKVITNVLGSGETDSIQLNTIGKELFEDKWNGVFARDQVNPNQEGYYICNLDTHLQQGSHWTALAVRGPVIYYFDSFARPQRKTLKLDDPYHIIISEKNPRILQNVKEENCGQRCLAWLMVFDQDPKAALSI